MSIPEITPRQRRFHNQLSIFHGEPPLGSDDTMTRKEASDRIGELVSRRDEVMPVQASTLEDVWKSHASAVNVLDEGRKTQAQMANELREQGVSERGARDVIVENHRLVVEQMTNGDRPREYGSPAQRAILVGIAREYPDTAEAHGFAEIAKDDEAMLRPRASELIQLSVNDGVNVGEIGYLNRVEQERQREAQQAAIAQQKAARDTAPTR